MANVKKQTDSLKGILREGKVLSLLSSSREFEIWSSVIKM